MLGACAGGRHFINVSGNWDDELPLGKAVQWVLLEDVWDSHGGSPHHPATLEICIDAEFQVRPCAQKFRGIDGNDIFDDDMWELAAVAFLG